MQPYLFVTHQIISVPAFRVTNSLQCHTGCVDRLAVNWSFMKTSFCKLHSSDHIMDTPGPIRRRPILPCILALIGIMMSGSKSESTVLPRGSLHHIPLKTGKVTVSGHSSGGVAATNFYLSHSGLVDGVALFSTVHYQCGNGGLSQFFLCLNGEGSVSKSISAARKFAAKGLVDPLENLWKGRHYIFHGTQDPVIPLGNGEQVYEFFKTLSPKVRFEQYGTMHGLPSRTCGMDYKNGGLATLLKMTTRGASSDSACSKSHFSVVYNGLNYIYKGDLKEPKGKTCRSKNSNDGLTLVDQSEFIPPQSEDKVSMQSNAVLYTPPQCRNQRAYSSTPRLCTLHVAFHGCRNSIENDGLDYIKCSGYLETADANDLIVLFPQVKATAVDMSALFNCWDLFGYTGPLYGTKRGSQNQVVHAMIDSIMNKTANRINVDSSKMRWVENTGNEMENYYPKRIGKKGLFGSSRKVSQTDGQRIPLRKSGFGRRWWFW